MKNIRLHTNLDDVKIPEHDFLFVPRIGEAVQIYHHGKIKRLMVVNVVYAWEGIVEVELHLPPYVSINDFQKGQIP